MRVKKANNELSKEELTKLKSIERQVTQDATMQGSLQDKTITQIRSNILNQDYSVQVLDNALPNE
jgi:hypothetical protein